MREKVDGEVERSSQADHKTDLDGDSSRSSDEGEAAVDQQASGAATPTDGEIGAKQYMYGWDYDSAQAWRCELLNGKPLKKEFTDLLALPEMPTLFWPHGMTGMQLRSRRCRSANG